MRFWNMIPAALAVVGWAVCQASAADVKAAQPAASGPSGVNVDAGRVGVPASSGIPPVPGSVSTVQNSSPGTAVIKQPTANTVWDNRPDPWRYKWENGRWWYYAPDNRWMWYSAPGGWTYYALPRSYTTGYGGVPVAPSTTYVVPPSSYYYYPSSGYYYGYPGYYYYGSPGLYYGGRWAYYGWGRGWR
jgi:hypothetical protein